MEAGGRWMMDDTAASRGGDDNNHQFFLGVGYRFVPTDEELVDYFLRRKIMGLPIIHPIIRHTINIYETHPRDILCKYGTVGEDACYFFVKQSNKSRKRRCRKAGNGYWRTSGSHPVLDGSGKKEIGSKKTFAFHQGFPEKGGFKGVKTDWLMHEFSLNHGDDNNNNIGDDYVLVRIYYHKKKNGNGKEKDYKELNNFTTPWHHDEHLLLPAPANNMEPFTGLEVETMSSDKDILRWLEHCMLGDSDPAEPLLPAVGC
ncbi:unnamed protein product [Cuscuta europaea]|uniref:NAC domain-containing protein n=1 Tax=Cuscuta europaea TaxID=41803 RepID=A0A9P1EKY8_CUSEU|nr:unnamed protein product [Cuscuta europaea]